MDIDKVFGRTADQVYEEVQRMIAETAAKYEKKVKNEKILVAAYSAALFLGMLSVLTYGRKLKGDFKNLKNTLDVGDERTLKTYLKYLEH